MLIGIIVIGFLLVILLFIAGRSDYWQAWVFFAVNTGIMIILFSALNEKIGIIRERMHPGVGTKWWDKVFWMIYGPMNLAILVVAALDAGRYFWSPPFPATVYIIGYIAYLLANAVHLWAIISNDFYTSTVRLQEERGQQVIDSGPYRLLRHPGYFGISLMLFCIALLLGSLWAMIPFSIVFILLIIRTMLEDKTLINELSGYREYTQKTRYRLIPGIW